MSVREKVLDALSHYNAMAEHMGDKDAGDEARGVFVLFRDDTSETYAEGMKVGYKTGYKAGYKDAWGRDSANEEKRMERRFIVWKDTLSAFVRAPNSIDVSVGVKWADAALKAYDDRVRKGEL